MTINRVMDKEVVLHIHNGILLNYKKYIFESLLMMWVKLEPAIQTEVSQREKQQYNISMCIYGIYNNDNDDPICKTSKETQL